VETPSKDGPKVDSLGFYLFILRITNGLRIYELLSYDDTKPKLRSS